jgi:uncharacterized protein (TIGR02246 family)
MTGIDMADYLAILSMDGEYARAWDTGDAAGWAALFTEDGSYETRMGDRPGTGARGRAQLEEFCRSAVAVTQGIHLCHTPAIEIDGDEARAWMQFEYRAQTGARQQMHVVGSYRTVYQRTRDGWRIRSRQSQIMESMRRDFFGVPGLGKEKFAL